MTEARSSGRAALLAGLLAGAPALAALSGSFSGRPLQLNLGPGDSPYIVGFTDHYEIDEKVATHWTTYDAEVRLPLLLEGRAELAFRYARVLPETAQIVAVFAGTTLDRFERRGGIFETRRTSVGVVGERPVRVAFKVDSHDRQRLGLKLDWVRIEPRRGARVRLSGAARWRAALLAVALVFLLRFAGWSLGTTALLAAPLSLLAAASLLLDPWLTHRLLTGVPELLLGLGVPCVAFGRRLVARGTATPDALRALTALACLAFLVRAAAVNHPDFYYPDQRTHARLVEFIAEGGVDFFVHPSRYISEHGVWRTEAYGRTYAFPYSPAFHLPFVALGLPYDARLTAMKLWAAALSVVPLVTLWALARRVGASVLGAVLMALVPIYMSRLSFAFLPALLGHAVDSAFLLWLSLRMPELERSRGALARGTLFVAATQLAYVSGLLNSCLFVAALAAFAAAETPPSAFRGVRLLAMGLVGSLFSLVLYYRDFLGMALDVLPRIAGGGASPARYPVQSFLSVVAERTHSFFDGVYPALALAGLVLLWLRGRGRSLLIAWAATYFLLLLGRAKVPDLFLHGHETLFVTPLVCLASGETLSTLWQAGRVGRLAAAVTLIFLAHQGFSMQWRSLSAQLANAL